MSNICATTSPSRAPDGPRALVLTPLELIDKTAQAPVQTLDEARVCNRSYFMKSDRRDQFNALPRQALADLRVSQGPGPQNIRRFKCRFDEMQCPGGVTCYNGWVVRLFEDAGERNVDMELDFQRGNNVLGRTWATFVLA